MNSLIENVKCTIEKNKLLAKGDGVVVGVSGGADSLCLIHLLKAIKEDYALRLYAVHLNHQFRGAEADADAMFVEEICKEWGIPAFIETFDIPAYIEATGLSPEEAGRKIRYKLFEEIRQKVNADKIAVAQNLNDNVETIIMRFMRGTGTDGLKGIEYIRGNIIRPLLDIERWKIEEYCTENNLTPRIDSTNLQTLYSRNKIRLELIPFIKDNFNPNINMAVIRLANLAKDENDFFDEHIAALFKEAATQHESTISFNIDILRLKHVALQRRLIRYGILQIADSLNGFDGKHFDGVLELLNKNTGSAIELPKEIRAYISYKELILTKNIEKLSKKCYYSLKHNTCISIPEFDCTIQTEKRAVNEINIDYNNRYEIFIDASKIKGELAVRNRKPGDVFSPIGMRGSKKLKDYLIDEKIPREMRDELLLVADGSEVVWIIGKRISEKYKITNETKEALMIKLIAHENNY